MGLKILTLNDSGDAYIPGILLVGLSSPIGFGKIEVKQSVDSVSGGIGTTNIAQSGTARMWVDSSNIMRLSSGSTEVNSIVLNGAGSGKVGIGTTTPDKHLHIVGNDATNPVLIKVSNISGGTSGDCGILFSTSATASSDAFGCKLIADRTDIGGSGVTDLVFYTSSVGPMDEKMRITGAGGVIIGASTSLGGKLHLKQTNELVTGGFTILNSGGDRTLNLWIDSSKICRIDSAQTGSGDIAFNSGSSGKVGIGKIPSLGQLDVAGDVYASEGFGPAVNFFRSANITSGDLYSAFSGLVPSTSKYALANGFINLTTGGYQFVQGIKYLTPTTIQMFIFDVSAGTPSTPQTLTSGSPTIIANYASITALNVDATVVT